MNENQQNFDELKRLLRLKQHEIPPPGYFNNFSDQIVSRIRAGEASGQHTAIERLDVTVPWLANLFRVFESKPGIVGGFAVSLCLLLVFGVVFAEYSERGAKPSFAIADPTPQPSISTLASLSAPVGAPVNASGGIVASTNPVLTLQPVTTLFGQSGPSALFQTAGFAPPR
jgi:hypothetical protein